ncbi:MAG: LuxR family transcriptional regulator [Methylocystis sp.]|nr:LuxR family transcriptional regulator [Methylocystis sp.]
MMRPALIEKIEKCVFNRANDEVLKVIAEAYGLTHIAYVGVHGLQSYKNDDPFSFLTYPKEWQEHYLLQGYLKVDPAVNLALNSLLPLDWSDIDKSIPNVKKLFGEAREFGIGETGLSIPIRGCHGELSLVALSGNFNKKQWVDFKFENMADLQIISVYLHQMIIGSFCQRMHPPKLSNREIECLKWAANGKTFEDIADIIGISSRTVKFYLDTARHKLNCLSIAHAVARATTMRIIPPTF